MGGRILLVARGRGTPRRKYAVEVLSDIRHAGGESKPASTSWFSAIESEWSNISARNLLANSGSVYGALIQPAAHEQLRQRRQPGRGRTRCLPRRELCQPRRRYATPMDAKALIFFAWLLPTVVWGADAFVKSAAKMPLKTSGQTS
jgi:hypothetical protein